MTTKFRGDFRTLEELDRYRKLRLGLPVSIQKNHEPPWGYKSDPENPRRAIPDEYALKMLFQAKEYSENYSLRDLAAWMSSNGYPLSHVALKHILKNRVPFKEILLPIEERLKL